MKYQHTLAALALLLAGTSFAQTVKDYPLRDFKAPDIRFRQLEITGSFSGNGSSDFDINTHGHTGNLAGSGAYFGFYNTQKRQGSNTINYNVSGSLLRTYNDSARYSGNVNQRLNWNSENRLFLKNHWFVGLHGSSEVRHTNFSSQLFGSETTNVTNLNVQVLPFVSIGKGRIEPLRYARVAQDILIFLEKKARLKRTPTEEEITTLANAANQIRYKRFFDNRFGRIYQLEALDSTLTALDLVSKQDIVYFAQLNDIWGFANQFERGSGSRWEAGIIPVFDYQSQTVSPLVGTNTTRRIIGNYIFGSFNKQTPLSYKWQSDYSVDLIYGSKDWRATNTTDSFSSESTESALSTMLNAGWTLGFYPNTRTRLQGTTFASAAYQLSSDETSNERPAYTFGFNADFYYWIAPRFRFSAQAAATTGGSFRTGTPAPFWGEIDQGTQAIREFEPNYSNVVNFNFNATLTYAIF